MSPKRREACGRCSMTTVVDAAEDGEENASNPFDGDRIELDESTLRRAVPHEVAAGRLRERIDAVAERVVFGRRDTD